MLDRELGRGGMATVFVAQDLAQGRAVALKVLSPEVASAVGVDRFRREIAIAASLQHPHILPLFDSGEAAGLLYYTMPLVTGESLRARIDREVQLPVDDAVQIAREVADALTFANSRGVVHRDIKPENILLDAGHALLTDFGIALAIGALVEADAKRLTSTGIAVGTPAYMSPEQAAADRRLDGRSDVYALGCVLYEMLAGEPPFTGPTAQAIAARRLTESPRSLRVVREAVTPALEASVMKALARAPADRWVTAATFSAGLEQATATRTTATLAVGGNPRWRRLLIAGITVAALGGAIIGGSAAWRAIGRWRGTAEPTRLAVLPFDNLGPPDQQYFADGIGDEVRGKLTQVPGLTVIARASSEQYRHSSKPPAEIGRELGAAYLLTGTVRWERHADGSSEVHVSPELIRVSDESARWEEGFDAPLTDVFQVQTGIAVRVAHALDVALGSGDQERLASPATKNLAAYDAYLQGEEISDRLGTVDPAVMRQAVEYYRRAVRLDSSFALAWARLGVAQAIHHQYDDADTAEVSEARFAVNRAVVLAPKSAQAHEALAMFHTLSARDYPAALAEWERAGALQPGSTAEVSDGRGLTEQFMGQWDESVRDLAVAHDLDPRSAATSLRLTRGLLWLRRYPDAMRTADSALRLAPTNTVLLELRAEASLGQGDLPGARAVLAAPALTDRRPLIALLLTVGDLYWVLDTADQRLLLSQPADSFGLDSVSWALGRAEVSRLRGDSGRTRRYADVARRLLEEAPGQAIGDPGILQLHAIALGLLGRGREAVREEEQSLAAPGARPFGGGAYGRFALIRIYVLAGQNDSALVHLAPLLNAPFYVSPEWLRIDPDFAPLRRDPRLARLTRGIT